MNENYSQKFRTYLGSIIIDEKPNLFICSEDDDGNTFFVLDKSEKIAFFSSVYEDELLIKYLIYNHPRKNQIFDWISNPDEIVVFFEMNTDQLSIPINIILSNENKAKNFINLYNLFTDYLLQTNQLKKYEKMKKSQLHRYWIFCYNNYVWRKRDNYSGSELRLLKIKTSKSVIKFKDQLISILGIE